MNIHDDSSVPDLAENQGMDPLDVGGVCGGTALTIYAHENEEIRLARFGLTLLSIRCMLIDSLKQYQSSPLQIKGFHPGYHFQVTV